MSFWYASYTGQNAAASCSDRFMLAATSSFLSARTFSLTISMLAADGSWAVTAGLASTAAAATAA